MICYTGSPCHPFQPPRLHLPLHLVLPQVEGSERSAEGAEEGGGGGEGTEDVALQGEVRKGRGGVEQGPGN